MSGDLYSLLGVKRDASMEAIKTAYRRAAMINHPDRHGGNNAKFIEITEAYEILNDSERRKIYDTKGLQGLHIEENKRPQPTAKRHQYGGTFEVPPNSEVFNNLFNVFFAQKTPPPAANQSINDGANDNKGVLLNSTSTTNQTIVRKLNVTLHEVYCGAQKTIKYERNQICQHCYGKGHKPHYQPQQCRQCNGTGRLIPPTINPLSGITIDCGGCHGKGSANDTCLHCQGRKILKTTETIEVSIEPGMNDKVRLKYDNLGHEEPGKVPGDLEIELVVDNPTLFRIEGNDLHLDLDISLSEALTCVERDVTFIDGTTIRIMTDKESASILQQGEAKIYRNNGLPIYSNNGGAQQYGDLIVHLNIQMPNRLAMHARKAIADLLQKHN